MKQISVSTMCLQNGEQKMGPKFCASAHLYCRHAGIQSQHNPTVAATTTIWIRWVERRTQTGVLMHIFGDWDNNGGGSEMIQMGGYDAALVLCLVRFLARRKDVPRPNIVMHSPTVQLTGKWDRSGLRADNLEVLSRLKSIRCFLCSWVYAKGRLVFLGADTVSEHQTVIFYVDSMSGSSVVRHGGRDSLPKTELLLSTNSF